jgi:hypothetical protein
MNRRRFIGTAGALAAVARPSAAAYPAVVLVVDPADPVANSAPAQWAAEELERALKNAGSTVQRRRTLAEAPKNNQCVVVAGSRSAVAAPAHGCRLDDTACPYARPSTSAIY